MIITITGSDVQMTHIQDAVNGSFPDNITFACGPAPGFLPVPGVDYGPIQYPDSRYRVNCPVCAAEAVDRRLLQR